jgi:hypothetical protein
MDAESEEALQSIIADVNYARDYIDEFFSDLTTNVKVDRADVDTESLEEAMGSIDEAIDKLDELECNDPILDFDEIREIEHYASFHGYQPGTSLSSWILEQLKKGEK